MGRSVAADLNSALLGSASDDRLVSTYELVGLPDGISTLICVLGLILTLGPYAGGKDFGILKVPEFKESARKLKLLGPVILALCILGFVPTWQSPAAGRLDSADDTRESEGDVGRTTPSPRVLSFVASQDTLEWQQATILSWHTEDASSIAIYADDDRISTEGKDVARDFMEVSPPRATKYTLEARGDNASVKDRKSVSIQVRSPDVTGAWQADRGEYILIQEVGGDLQWRGFVEDRCTGTFLNYGAGLRVKMEPRSSVVSPHDLTGQPDGKKFPETITWEDGTSLRLVKEPIARIAYQPLTLYGKWRDHNRRVVEVTQSHDGQQSESFEWTQILEFETGQLELDGATLSAKCTPTSAAARRIAARVLSGSIVEANGPAGRSRATRIRWDGGGTLTRTTLPFPTN